MARRRTAWTLPYGGRRMGGSVAKYNSYKKKRRPWGIVPMPGSGSGGSLYIPPGGGIMPPRPPYNSSTSSSKKKMDVSIRPVGTGSSYSYYKYSRKPSKGSRIVRTQQAPLFNVFNSGVRFTSLQGEQSFGNNMAFRAADLRSLYLETSSNADGKFWVDWARTRAVFQNQSEATCFITIYEIACRRDTNVGPTLAFQSGMASIQAGSGSNAYDIGATPFMTPRFTENFKILKKYNVELAQGRTHIHTSMYKLGRNYSDSIYQMDGSNNTLLGTWSRGIFYIAWGTPFNSASDKTKVSTTPVALDIVFNTTYSTHSNLQNKSIFEVQSDFPTFSDGQIIDIGSGEPDAVGDA